MENSVIREKIYEIISVLDPHKSDVNVWVANELSNFNAQDIIQATNILHEIIASEKEKIYEKYGERGLSVQKLLLDFFNKELSSETSTDNGKEMFFETLQQIKPGEDEKNYQYVYGLPHAQYLAILPQVKKEISILEPIVLAHGDLPHDDLEVYGKLKKLESIIEQVIQDKEDENYADFYKQGELTPPKRERRLPDQDHENVTPIDRYRKLA